MTDKELIELVETKAPEELTVAELECIRSRLAESAALQEALAGRLEMEQYLAHTLGGIDVTFDQILARATQMRSSRPHGVLSALGWVLCSLLVAFVMLILVLAIIWRPAGDQGDGELAENDPAARARAAKAAADGAAPLPSAAEELDKQKPKTAESGNAGDTSDPSQPFGKGNPGQAVAIAPPWEPSVPWDEQPEPGPEDLFEDIDTKTPSPSVADLRQWFTDLQGGRQSFTVREVSGIQCGMMNGLFQLRAPLAPKTALRVSLHDFNNLRIHCWSGTQGVTLQYLERMNRSWVGYAATRKGSEPRPAMLYLTATDDDRYCGTNPITPAMHELRYEDNHIVLSRGDVRVLSLPLASPPREVYFEGQAIFRHIAMTKAAPLPPEPAPLPVALDVKRPAELKWIEQLPKGSKLEKLPDGSVELSAEKTGARVSAAVPLPAGLYEVILQIDSPSPGTCVYLGDAEDKIQVPIAFYNDSRLGQVSVSPTYPGDQRTELPLESIHAPAPYVTARPWLRLVYGGGPLKCWTSIDGEHWARVGVPIGSLTSGETIGLYCPTLTTVSTKRSIKLRRLQLREFAALSSLAPKELRDKVRQLPSAEIGPWLEAVFESQPVGADPTLWRRACAIQTLGRGANSALAAVLLENLAEEGLTERNDTAWQMQLLHEGALLLSTLDDPAIALRWAQKFERVGQLACERGEPQPYTLVAHAQMTAPLWTRSVYNFFPDKLLRTEMFELMYHNRWDELHYLCERVRTWKRQAYSRSPGIVDWAAAVALRGTPAPADLKVPESVIDIRPKKNSRQIKVSKKNMIAMENEWRHPLITELSKEGFNVLAEFEAALDGNSYKDACQIISNTAGPGILGLLPNARDPQLLMSLSGAVTLAMRDHAELAMTMRDDFGPVGLLRIRQAIRDGDVPALEAATLQFYGTPAAAEAHQWLGDRALSGGAFARALGHYRLARHSAESDLQPRLTAGEKLAAAMTGQSIEEPVSAPVEFGKTRLAPVELTRLIEDLRTHHTADALGSRQTSAAGASQVVPSPAQFEATVQGPFNGDQGQSPQAVPSPLTDYDVDWCGRQLATALDGDRLIVSNRFQVSVYNLKEHRWEWRTNLGGEQGGAHDSSLTPMRPLVTPTRIFVRRLTKLGPTLASLDPASGKVLWSTRSESDRNVVSDPLLVQDELFALVMLRSEQEYALVLCTYDPQTGTLLSERRLVQLRDSWLQQHTCQAIAADDRFIIVCGGSVLCYDLAGQPRWVRRQNLVPIAVDRTSARQAHDLPLLSGDRLYVTQPGIRAVECLDAETGRLHWRRVLPDLQRLLALREDRVIVHTDGGIVALEAASGKLLWQFNERNLLDGYLCGVKGGLLITRSEPCQGDERLRPALVWLDPATGRETAVCRLDKLRHKRPRLGPLVAYEDRIWSFARSAAGEQRDLVELVPSEEPLPAAESPIAWEPWTNHVPKTLQDAAARVFPGWSMLDGRADNNTGYKAGKDGEKDALCTLSPSGRAMVLARHLKLPKGKPKLSLLVGNDPQGKWRLAVRVNGDELLAESIDKKFTGGDWKSVEVDLSSYAGREVNLVVRGLDDGNQSYAKWKRLAIE